MVYMTHNTFTITRTNDGWSEYKDRFTVECSCGIASGTGHATAEAARREPMHICPNTRTYPVWDGIEP